MYKATYAEHATILAALMRANTPACPLGPVRAIPLPKYKIGDRVRINYRHVSDKPFFERTYLEHLIRDARRFQKVGRLPIHLKVRIRECLRRLHEAIECEIVGIIPKAVYNTDYVGSNACYVAGVPGASSPMYYHYQILIRFTNDKGHQIAMITGCPIGCDGSFVPIEREGHHDFSYGLCGACWGCLAGPV